MNHRRDAIIQEGIEKKLFVAENKALFSKNSLVFSRILFCFVKISNGGVIMRAITADDTARLI